MHKESLLTDAPFQHMLIMQQFQCHRPNAHSRVAVHVAIMMKSHRDNKCLQLSEGFYNAE